MGMCAAGWTHLWGVEFDPHIASVAHMNDFTSVIIADVRCVDYSKLERPDHLHASPSCKRASVANSEGIESDEDIEAAEAVCRALRCLKPDTFTLENVYAYRKFKAYQIISTCLDDLGYWWEHHHLNSADFAVPQTRRRLFIRATQHTYLRPLPAPTDWIGWFESIQDLIPTLPESRFADWQIMRLPSELTGDFLHMTSNTQKANPTGTGENARPAPANTVTSADGARPRAFLTDSCINTCREATVIDGESPAFTVKAEAFRRPITEPKAFLVDGDNAGKNGPIAHQQARPAPAVVSSGGHRRAFIVDGKPASYDGALSVTGAASETPTLTASQEKHPFRAWLSQGRVVSMTPRALARFMSLPDWYILPQNKKLACVILGNGVPCLMMQRIAESLQ